MGLVLGITGGIAAGKSTVSRLLAQRGAVVVSADQLARELVAPGRAALRRLVDCFGSAILLSDGQLDRAGLGALVFADADRRRQLEAILHPAIASLSRRRLRQAARQTPLVVYEAPLLYEVGAEKRVDRVLTVTVDSAVQLQRLQRRDGGTVEEARRKVAAQMSQAEKARRADYVIDNSADLAALQRQVAALWQRLQAEGLLVDVRD